MAMSPADRQVQANEDVDRIARAMCIALNRAYGDDEVQLRVTDEIWNSEAFAVMRERWQAVARDLLQRDVIRVGHRPSAERPMEGQTSIDDEPMFPLPDMDYDLKEAPGDT